MFPARRLPPVGGIFFVTVVGNRVSPRNKTVVRTKAHPYLLYQGGNVLRDTRKSQAWHTLFGGCITCII